MLSTNNTRFVGKILFLGAAALLLVGGYQACSPYQGESQDSGAEAFASHSPNFLVNATSAEEDFSQKGYIDVLDYMNSANIRGNQGNYVHFRHEARVDGKTIISATKFNDPINIEIFTADQDYVYIRYESTPEAFGNIKNSIRRNEGTSAAAVSFRNVPAVLGDSHMGSVWAERFIGHYELSRPIVRAKSVDWFQYSDEGVQDSGRGSDFRYLYIWYDIQPVEAYAPFVSMEHQPKDKLVISQQWSRCNIEQYEYAKGIGYVGWRSLVSTNPECRVHYPDIEVGETVTFKNYYRAGTPMEDYAFHRGTGLNEPLHLFAYRERVEPSFEVMGVFLDDLPYFHTSPTPLLSALRTSPEEPIVENLVDESTPADEPAPNEESVDLYSEIDKIYQELLGRSANAAGLEFYIQAVQQGLSFDELRSNLMQSHEYQVRQLYLLHLQREPDAAGLAFYIGVLEAGQSLNIVKEDIQKSNECVVDCLSTKKTTTGGSNESEAPPQPEKKGPSDTDAPEESNTDPSPVVEEPIDDADSTNQVDAATEIEKIYQEVLGRSADLAGLQFYMAAYENGLSLTAIRRDIEGSNESKVRQLYLTHLLREPDVGGRAFYKGLLDNVTSYQVVRDKIRESSECKVDCL